MNDYPKKKNLYVNVINVLRNLYNKPSSSGFTVALPF